MARPREEIGILLVHGMGEQKPREHLRTSAKELASFIAADPANANLDIAPNRMEPCIRF